MAQIREMLQARKGNRTIEDWAREITEMSGNKIGTSTLSTYLNGKRNIGLNGARAFYGYFDRIGDTEMKTALTEFVLGI